MWRFERATDTRRAIAGGSFRASVAVSVAMFALVAATAGTTSAAEPERITIGIAGAEPNGRSELPATNADGSVVVFKSLAANLVADDGNDRIDVFAYDRVTGEIERVPKRPRTGDDPLDESFPPVVSDDGRFVAFGSAARNLIIGDFNLFPDAYRHDRATGETENLSLVIEPGSGEGRLGGRVPDIPVSISADGRFVAFTSASGHIAGVDTNETHDVFVYDAESESVELISVPSLGVPTLRAANDLSGAGVLSPDGGFVAFCSEASNLTVDTPRNSAGIFLRDRTAQQTILLALLTGGRCLQREFMVSVSEGADRVAFVTDLALDGADDNGVTDVYVWQRDAGVTLVSRSIDGASGNTASSFPSISRDGRFIAFQSGATDLVDAPDGNGAGTDVFVADLLEDRIERLTSNGGELATGDSFAPWISRDGTVVVFQSDARLTSDDANAFPDIYAIVNELSFTQTPTETPTVTATPTSTATSTPTSTPTRTATATLTATVPEPTRTPTSDGGDTTPTPTMAETGTETPGPTQTPDFRSSGDGSLPLASLLVPALIVALRRRGTVGA